MKKPNSTLATRLARAATIKHEMTDLLRQLEATAAGKPVDKPGGWRHHPTAWAGKHLPQSPTPESPPDQLTT